jgi:hypothetical protein
MKKLVVLLALAAAALAYARPAAADYSLSIAPSVGNLQVHGTRIEIATGDSLRAPASVKVYVPNGYGLTLNDAPGTQVGEAVAFVGSPSGSGLAFGDGEIDAIAPNAVPAADQSCAPGTHAAAWQVQGQTDKLKNFSFTIFADPTSGADTAFGAFTLQWCTPQVGHVLDVALLLNTVVKPGVSGMYLWRAVATPQGLTPSAAVELRAVVPTPDSLTVTSRRLSRARVLTVTGRLVVGTPKANARIDALPLEASNGSGAPSAELVGAFGALGIVLPHTTTRADGTFTLRIKLRKKENVVALIYAGAPPALCGGPSPAPSGCLDQTTAAPNPVIVHVPKKT